MTTGDVAVLLFGERRLPRALRGLPVLAVHAGPDIDDAVAGRRRVIVVGAEPDLAAVLTRLLRLDLLEVEVGHAPDWRSARRARTAAARRVPLIRDEIGKVIVGGAEWRGHPGGSALHGEAVVDDTVLFDGDTDGVRVEPTQQLPGLRAALTRRGRPRRWVAGRAAQLGTTGAQLTRDGVAAPSPVKRSTFFRHTQGWLRVG